LIRGTAPGGLSDTSGNFLAGNTSTFRARNGSDNVTFFRQSTPFVPAGRKAAETTGGHALSRRR
jgi:hypothetical protein